MRIVTTGSLTPGKILAKSIFNENGLILLGEGVELTQAILDRLQKHGIEYVYIMDERTEDIVVEELITHETRSIAMAEIRTNFRKVMEDSSRKHGFTSVQLGKQFKELVNLIHEDLSRNKDALIMLANMSVVDHYLYNHSLNVCLYSTMVGMFMDYSQEELMALSLGAILHDIGKTRLPMSLLSKPGKLTDEEFQQMKSHTSLGFQILKDVPNVPLLSAHCAYQHHERVDGSGYPRGIDGEEMHEFAKIVGLCDVYDALTTNRAYRKAYLPHEGMEMIYSSAAQFDQKLIELFRSKVAIYPLGMTVRLNTGQLGVVVDLNRTALHRPIVRVLEDENGQELGEPYEIDLSKQLNVMIDSVGDC